MNSPMDDGDPDKARLRHHRGHHLARPVTMIAVVTLATIATIATIAALSTIATIATIATTATTDTLATTATMVAAITVVTILPAPSWPGRPCPVRSILSLANVSCFITGMAHDDAGRVDILSNTAPGTWPAPTSCSDESRVYRRHERGEHAPRLLLKSNICVPTELTTEMHAPWVNTACPSRGHFQPYLGRWMRIRLRIGPPRTRQ
jgi:hypothetical protein